MTPFSPLSSPFTLPDETWSQILRFLSFKAHSNGIWKDSIQQKDLTACSLVCTKWYQLVQPLLLKHISLNGREDNFWRMKQVGRLGYKKGAGERVKTMAVHGYLTGESFNDELLKSVVGACVNLTEAHFEVCNVDLEVLVRSSGHLKHLHLLNCLLVSDSLAVSSNVFPSLTHLAIQHCTFQSSHFAFLIHIFRTPSNQSRCPVLEGLHFALLTETADPTARNGLSIAIEVYCKSLKSFSGKPSFYEPRLLNTVQALPRLQRIALELSTITKYDWQLVLFTRVTQVWIICESTTDFFILQSLFNMIYDRGDCGYTVKAITIVTSITSHMAYLERVKEKGLRMGYKFQVREKFDFVEFWEEGSTNEGFFFGGKTRVVAQRWEGS